MTTNTSQQLTDADLNAIEERAHMSAGGNVYIWPQSDLFRLLSEARRLRADLALYRALLNRQRVGD